MSRVTDSYAAGSREALLRMKLAAPDFTSNNPMRWFPWTEPHAGAAEQKARAAWDAVKRNAPAVGYAALGAGTLYALAKAYQAIKDAPTPQNDEIPQVALSDYLRSYQ